MDKFFDNVEKGLMTVFVLLGTTGFIGGIVTGKGHCFILAAMCFLLPYVWYVEEYKSKGKVLWQKKSIKKSRKD